MPFFSVIVPVYNVEKYLHQCVDSILNQTFEDFELILVNDGSKDQSGRMCDEIAKRDYRVVVKHQANGGLSVARNTGLSLVKGKYILFIDSDDFWKHNNVLKKIRSIIDSNNTVDLIEFKMIKFLEKENKYIDDSRNFTIETLPEAKNDELIYRYITNDLLSVSACNKVIRTKTLLRHKLFFKEGIYSEDIDWFCHLLLNVRNILLLDEGIYVYRKQRDGSITASKGKKNISDILDTIEKWIENIENHECSDTFKFAYLSFISYQYSILLGLIHLVKKEEKSELLVRLRMLEWLLKYNGSSKVRKVIKIYKIFGFNVTTFLLHLYIRKK